MRTSVPYRGKVAGVATRYTSSSFSFCFIPRHVIRSQSTLQFSPPAKYPDARLAQNTKLTIEARFSFFFLACTRMVASRFRASMLQLDARLTLDVGRPSKGATSLFLSNGTSTKRKISRSTLGMWIRLGFFTSDARCFQETPGDTGLCTYCAKREKEPDP